MTYTILIPLLITLAAFIWAHRQVRSQGLGGAVELLLASGAAAILSLGAWLVWALAMWGLA